MAGDKLHGYDLWLCHYAISNLQLHINKPDFIQYVSAQLGPGPLRQYVLKEGLEPDDIQKRILLNDAEFDALQVTTTIMPNVLTRMWLPYNALHGWYIDTIAEARDSLTMLVAEDWSQACVRYAKQLDMPRVELSTGIEIVRQWCRDLRKVLRAMGANHYLPCPEGAFPTPTSLTPASPVLTVSDANADDIEKMRKVIAEHDRNYAARPKEERGRHAPPKELIPIASISNKRGRNALRQLQEMGEYEGFARPRPSRYSEGRPNEK